MSFFGITDFGSYLLGTLAIIVLPGPNSFYCLYAATQSVQQGYKAVAGIFLGDTILMCAAVLGAAALLQTNPSVFLAFKVLGGLYLAYVGYGLLVAGYRRLRRVPTAQSASPTAKQPKPSPQREPAFTKAIVLSISNPKAIIFFLSFFLQFVDPNFNNPLLSFFILGVSLQIMNMAYLWLLVRMGGKIVVFFQHQHLISSLSLVSIGLLFISFAASLWFSSI